MITLTDIVENYPAFLKVTGEELAQKLEAHALVHGYCVSPMRMKTR